MSERLSGSEQKGVTVHRAVRFGGELLGGAAGGLLIAVGSMNGLCSLDARLCLGHGTINALLGFGLGAAVGVTLTGYLLDGDGKVPGVLAGMSGGALLVGALLWALSSSNATNNPLIGVAILAAPLIGAALGYELTSADRRSEAGGSFPLAPSVAPTANGQGALIGVIGRF